MCKGQQEVEQKVVRDEGCPLDTAMLNAQADVQQQLSNQYLFLATSASALATSLID